MKYLKTFEKLENNEYIKESVTDPLLVVLLILFIKSKGLTLEKMASNLKSWVVEFCSFVSAYGFAPLAFLILSNAISNNPCNLKSNTSLSIGN